MIKNIVRPPTLTAAVADAIREAIIRGDFLPGEPLHEVELSKTINTSRSTVREALRCLQLDGLVEVFPYRGAFVTRLSALKVKEIYTLRALLEPYAVRLSIESNAYLPEDIKELNQLIQRMRENESGGDYYEMITADMEFHAVICRRCKHSLLLDVLENIRSYTLLFILNTKLYRSDMVRDDASHAAILDAILTGDAKHAEAVVLSHITDAGTSLDEKMVEREQSISEPSG